MNPLSSYLGGGMNKQSTLSPIGQQLGFGGDALGQQVADETDEERRKRLQQMQQRGMFAPPTAALLNSFYG
jgi:hypothetical protein